MKRILALILVLTLAVFAFAACDGKEEEDNYKMSTFKKNLEKKDYVVEVVDDEDDIEAMFEMLNLDYNDYKVKKILTAYSEDYENNVTIIECGAEKNAKSLKKDYAAVMEQYENLLDSNMKTEVAGSFFIVGTSNAVKAAKG